MEIRIIVTKSELREMNTNKDRLQTYIWRLLDSRPVETNERVEFVDFNVDVELKNG